MSTDTIQTPFTYSCFTFLTSSGSYDSEDLWRNAGVLAAVPPLCASLDELHVQVSDNSSRK